MAYPPATTVELEQLSVAVDAWLVKQLDTNLIVVGVDRPAAGQWHVRLRGEQKDAFAVLFELGQRTLSYETYVMPAPEENAAEFYRHLLVRNQKLYGAAFVVGEEEAIFLRGQLDRRLAAEPAELDRVLGSLYSWVEQFFRPALAIGFSSRFR